MTSSPFYTLSASAWMSSICPGSTIISSRQVLTNSSKIVCRKQNVTISTYTSRCQAHSAKHSNIFTDSMSGTSCPRTISRGDKTTVASASTSWKCLSRRSSRILTTWWACSIKWKVIWQRSSSKEKIFSRMSKASVTIRTISKVRWVMKRPNPRSIMFLMDCCRARRRHLCRTRSLRNSTP